MKYTSFKKGSVRLMNMSEEFFESAVIATAPSTIDISPSLENIATYPNTELADYSPEKNRAQPIIPPGYHIERELGKGGQGHVYLARKPTTNQNVALKTISPDAPIDHVFIFHREIDITLQLRHPNIPRVHECGTHKNVPYFSLDYIPGETLGSVIISQAIHGPTYTLAERLEILETLAETLDYAHQNGIIHLDVKPANVIIDPTGKPHLFDWGIAKYLNHEEIEAEELETIKLHDHTLNDRVKGTANYMAPEQAQLEPATEKSDIYSLGAISLELLSRITRPFRRFTTKNTAERILRVAASGGKVGFRDPIDLDPQLQDILLRAIETDPKNRYSTAHEFAQTLRDYSRDKQLYMFK